MIRSYGTYGAGRRLAGGKIKDTKITQFIFRSVLQCEQSAEIKFHAGCSLGYMDKRSGVFRRKIELGAGEGRGMVCVKNRLDSGGCSIYSGLGP